MTDATRNPAYPPERGMPGALKRLLTEDWSEMTRAALTSPNHVSSDDRWTRKAREANPALDDDQAYRLGQDLKHQHYVRMGKLSVQARRIARETAEAERELADDPIDVIEAAEMDAGELRNPSVILAHPMPADADIAEPEPCPFHSGNGALGECNCELKKYALRPIVLHMQDPEVSAIGCILAVLEDLDGAAIRRVLRWACERYGVST